MQRLLRCFLYPAFAFLFCTSLLHAQASSGAVTGIVTDPSGAVVSNAHVLIHNLDTGIDSSADSKDTGFYRFDFLAIGRYQLTISANGFETAKTAPFALEVLQVASFNFKLQVGSASTTVNVTTAAPILNTENAAIGTVFTSNTITNLPLSGLDFSALSLYVPGSVNTNGTSGMQNIERNTYYSDTPNMNGNRAQANNYTLDGIDINEDFNNLIAYSPAPEALAEIRMLTADSPAEYGNVNGGGIVSVLKSGTNQFHGSLYGYAQDYRFNANSWTNNNQGISTTPFSSRNLAGRSVGRFCTISSSSSPTISVRVGIREESAPPA